jgi:hypothetical protein
MAVSYISGGNLRTRRKPPTYHKFLPNDTYALVVSDTGRFVNFIVIGEKAPKITRDVWKYQRVIKGCISKKDIEHKDQKIK